MRSGADGTAADLSALVTGMSVIVCCGSGGTGKTTVSAAIGLAGAEQGRKACVVTIDPARGLRTRSVSSTSTTRRGGSWGTGAASCPRSCLTRKSTF